MIATVLLLVALPQVATVALCDSWFDVRVRTSKPVPDGMTIHVVPVNAKLIEPVKAAARLDEWGFEKHSLLSNDGLTISVGHSHRNWCGYSYNHVQQYDTLLVRIVRTGEPPEFRMLPIPLFPVKTPVEIVVAIPN